ncbi:hypothetical protein HETIRDRAFT_164389 [Heterobasidion irregulare TC 32-1]|uniref:Fungal-type protein kinase domain-containing protein n=1 Tax=Heterobasidion irregulare (strain TC 32-1) TaxID=747525 RepID=W4JRI1_HETIT|nr:uncharacterized protein HETIRDRAFT_164389 [Heterobasidion irregulare TC 32-1]ETW75476.1 hypothetical protein HETIRDRAFT_164389 [Heterobasidion irregulare TC 32-1]
MFGVRSGKPYGILIDWDLAIDMKSRDSVSSRHRTGTGPFMAVDHLGPKMGSPYFYRHDLESLFYILLWSACAFLLNGTEVKKQHQIVEHWSVATWGDVKDKKIAFFAKTKDEFEVLSEAVTAPFRPILDSWLRPLAELVAWAHAKANERAPHKRRSSKRAPLVDLETLGGNMTYKVFFETLNVDLDTASHSSDHDLFDRLYFLESHSLCS